MAMPNDTFELQALIDSGKVEPESIVALVGKTEGTGFHDDMGRVLADGALRGWVAGQLGIDVSEVAERVTFVLSGLLPFPRDRHDMGGDKGVAGARRSRPGGACRPWNKRMSRDCSLQPPSLT
jgi:amidohydrolase ring-opening protein AtzD/TrzD